MTKKKKKKKNKRIPLSYFTNRLGIVFLCLCCVYGFYYQIKNNVFLGIEFIGGICGGFGIVIATPNKSIDKMINRE